MGLKKDAPPEVESEAGQAPAAAPTPPPEQPPAAAPKKTAKEVPGKREDTVMLLAVKRPISDPFTGVLYDMIHAKPGVRKKGNWVDCQMVAGILAER